MQNCRYSVSIAQNFPCVHPCPPAPLAFAAQFSAPANTLQCNERINSSLGKRNLVYGMNSELKITKHSFFLSEHRTSTLAPVLLPHRRKPGDITPTLRTRTLQHRLPHTWHSRYIRRILRARALQSRLPGFTARGIGPVAVEGASHGMD